MNRNVPDYIQEEMKGLNCWCWYVEVVSIREVWWHPI